MDPDETLKLFYDAVRAGNSEESDELYDDLKQWLGGGGFEPDWCKWHTTREAFFKEPKPVIVGQVIVAMYRIEDGREETLHHMVHELQDGENVFPLELHAVMALGAAVQRRHGKHAHIERRLRALRDGEVRVIEGHDIEYQHGNGEAYVVWTHDVGAPLVGSLEEIAHYLAQSPPVGPSSRAKML